MTGKAVPFISRRIRWFEKFSEPRLAGLFNQRWFIRILGLVIIVFTIGAFIAPPFSGLDTLPALGVVIICLAIVLEDVVVLAVGGAIGAGGIALDPHHRRRDRALRPQPVLTRLRRTYNHVMVRGDDDQTRALRRTIRLQHPPFVHAVLEDAKVTASYRAERFEFRSRADAIGQALRLAWVSDAFFAQVCYRAKARFQALGVPVLPRLAHRLAMTVAQVSIGDPVVIQPGLYLAHGQVVIDGLVTIDRGVVIFPWVTIGLRAGVFHGPTVEQGVHIGTGAKVLGPVTLGARAQVGANAVVVDDVPPNTTVVGAPARPIGQ